VLPIYLAGDRPIPGDDSVYLEIDQFRYWYSPPADPSYDADIPSVQRIFEAPQGDFDVYSLGKKSSDRKLVVMSNTISLVFIPESYGTVEDWADGMRAGPCCRDPCH
jgi:hypothetical protein